MAAGNDNLWAAVCRAIDRLDLAGDARFASTLLRAATQTVLREILEADFAQTTCKNLLVRFAAASVPCAPINSYSEVLSDPQVAFMKWIREIELPGGARTRTMASPIGLSGEEAAVLRSPPQLGEHNGEVFAELEAAK